MADGLVNIKAGKVNNGATVMGALPGGQYNRIQQGIPTQVAYSGEVMTVPSGAYTVPDDGIIGTRFHDPQATKVKFY